MPALQVREMPDELYVRLKESAKRNHRSLAQESVSILESALMPKQQVDVPFETEEEKRRKRAAHAKKVLAELHEYNKQFKPIDPEVHKQIMEEIRKEKEDRPQIDLNIFAKKGA